MSTVVLYCWCHSDSTSVLLYFTLVYDPKRSRILRGRRDLLYDHGGRDALHGLMDLVYDSKRSQEGTYMFICQRDQLYDSKGHIDLFGRLTWIMTQ